MCFSHGHFYKAGSLGKRHTAEQRLPRRTPPQLEAVRGMDQRGWVLIAFHKAFRHLATGTPIEDALIETVSKGGDTDTNAAICGALLGAAQGRAAIPVRWCMAVLACRPFGDSARQPRPARYSQTTYLC